jgi:class 3 adenylate cyclase
MAPDLARDEHYREWFGRLVRLSVTPGMALALLRMNTEIDVREILPTIQVPTLVLNRAEDGFVAPGHSRYLADEIPGARHVELEGAHHWPWAGNTDAVLEVLQEFVTGVRGIPKPERVLATVLLVDIAGSTKTVVGMGDSKWTDLIEGHRSAVRRELARFGGTEIDMAGDGALARFDGPTRAIGCAAAIRQAVRRLGIDTRAGIHTGECEMENGRLTGITVHVGARVMAQAAAGEILVSRTVKELVIGSGMEFEDRGRHVLKGLPGEWRLFATERAGGTGAPG